MTKTAVFIALCSFLICGQTHAHMDGLTVFNAEARLYKFTEPEEVKIRKAISLIKRVVASEDFKEEILNHAYEGRLAFANNRGLSNEKIYKKIIEGSERLSPGVDYTMNLTLEAFYTDSITVGYTNSGSPKIYMNRRFFSRQQPYEVTSNIIHEWLHKIGFGHDVSETPSRPYSVPYAVGYIVRKLARKL